MELFETSRSFAVSTSHLGLPSVWHWHWHWLWFCEAWDEERGGLSVKNEAGGWVGLEVRCADGGGDAGGDCLANNARFLGSPCERGDAVGR